MKKRNYKKQLYRALHAYCWKVLMAKQETFNMESNLGTLFFKYRKVTKLYNVETQFVTGM